MATRKKTKSTQPTYEVIQAVRLRQPILDTSSKVPKFSLDYISTAHFGKVAECTKALYKAVTEDNLYQNYRLEFKLHKNTDTGLVEYITTSPKDIYGAYEVEYQEDINLPDKEVYKAP